MIQNITLYGAGLIGSGWATHLLRFDIYNVTLFDLTEEALRKAGLRISRNLDLLVDENVLTAEERDRRLKKLRFTTDKQQALAQADLVLECCPENLALKQSVMSDIEACCRPSTIIATSTSGISVTLIARSMVHPERLVGTHPYHPVHLLPLVEMAGGEKTSPEHLRTLVGFFRDIRKEPVVLKKESPGYIGSRLMSVLFRESTHMIQSGITTMEDIDRAFTYGPGMRYGLMGINLTLQLAGGEHGIQGTLFGGIGSSGGNWLESFANFTRWPESYMSFWQTCQEQMDLEMSRREDSHGRTNEEIEHFRDRGLIQLLRHHGKL